MSGSLDQFTINYRVQVNAAVTNLTKLNAATAKTNKALIDSAKGAVGFADAITNNLGGALPVLGRVSSALKAITSEFGVLTAAATVTGAAIYNAMKVRAQFNEQRVQSRDAGISAVRLEDLQRRMASGNVSRAQVAGAVTGSQSFLRNAYADPSRIGPGNRLLGILGINPAAGGSPISNTDFMTKLASRWHTQSDSTVSAEAQMVGIDKDVALKMKELGASIGQIGMSLKEMQQYLDVAKNVRTLNDELARFNEQITQLGEKFAGPVLTSVTTLLKMINDAHLPTTDAGAARAMDHQLGAGEDAGSGIAEALINDKAEKEAAAKVDRAAAQDLFKKQEQTFREQQAKDAEEQKQKQELAKAEDKGNETFQSTVSDMELAINAFGASVNQFGHTIDANQARAAWAGVVGLAGGISSSGHKTLGYGETPGTVAFDPSAANAQYGAAANSASRNNPGNIRDSAFARRNGATGASGGFAVFPDMATGTAAQAALLQVYRGQGKDTISAIVKKWAPSNENDTAGYIDFVSKRTGIDANRKLTDADYEAVRAAMAVREGASGSGGRTLTGPQAVAMDPNWKGPWKFSGPTNLASGKGESFESIQLLDLQKSVAERAGVSLSQLQQGGAKFGDANFGLQSYMTELANNRASIKQGLGVGALTDIQRANLMGSLKSVDLQILNSSRYAPQILGNTTPGGRENTIGQVPPVVNINFNGNGHDQQGLIKVVRDELKGAFGQLSNSSATARRQ